MTLPRTHRLGWESSPKTMRAHGKPLPMTWRLGFETLCRTCKLGCESLPRTMQPCVWDLTYDPVDSSVNPCLGHLLTTPAEAVVNNIYHWHIWTYNNSMATDQHQQAGDVNFKIKTCNQFSRNSMQHLLNEWLGVVAKVGCMLRCSGSASWMETGYSKSYRIIEIQVDD